MPKRTRGGAIRLIENAPWRSGLHSPEREIVRLLAEAGITVSESLVRSVKRRLVMKLGRHARPARAFIERKRAFPRPRIPPPGR